MSEFPSFWRLNNFPLYGYTTLTYPFIYFFVFFGYILQHVESSLTRKVHGSAESFPLSWKCRVLTPGPLRKSSVHLLMDIWVIPFFFYFTILYWFCHTSTWIRHGCTCVSNPEPPSCLPAHTIPLGHPSEPAPSFLYPALNLDWRFISYMGYSFFWWLWVMFPWTLMLMNKYLFKFLLLFLLSTCLKMEFIYHMEIWYLTFGELLCNYFTLLSYTSLSLSLYLYPYLSFIYLSLFLFSVCCCCC